MHAPAALIFEKTAPLSTGKQGKSKGKIFVQALRLCAGRTAHRGSKDIALLFLDHDTRRG